MYQSDLQNAKELVWRFYQKLDNAKVSEMADIIAAHTDEHHI
ncbi:MAG: nuclear transport factor 2 family protein, partial [Rhodobacteraceae bacterium]